MRRNKSNTKGRTVVGSCLLSALLARSRPPKSFSRPRQSPAKINSDFSLAACKRTKCPPFSCIERCTNAEGVSTQFMPEQVGRGNKFEHGELLKMKKTRTVRFSSYWLFARQNRHWSTANFSYIIFPYRPRFVKNWEDIAFLCVNYASVIRCTWVKQLSARQLNETRHTATRAGIATGFHYRWRKSRVPEPTSTLISSSPPPSYSVSLVTSSAAPSEWSPALGQPHRSPDDACLAIVWQTKWNMCSSKKGWGKGKEYEGFCLRIKLGATWEIEEDGGGRKQKGGDKGSQ